MTLPGDLLTQEEKERGYDTAADIDFGALEKDQSTPAPTRAGDPVSATGALGETADLLTREEKEKGYDTAANVDFGSLRPAAPSDSSLAGPAARTRRIFTNDERKARAKASFILAQEKTQQIKNEIIALKAKLKKYKGLVGFLRIGLPKNEFEYKRLQSQLNELEGQDGTLEIAQDELEKAKQKALRAGVAESELTAKISEQTRPDTPYPTESDGTERSGAESPRKIWAKEIAKGILGAGAFVFGVDAAYILPMFAIERVKVGAIKKEAQEIIQALKELAEQVPAQTRAEFEETLNFQEKVDQLTEKITGLEKSGNLRPQDKERLLAEIKKAVDQYRTATADAKKERSQELGAILNDYIQYKTTKLDVGKSLLNAAFVATGYQLARGAAMLGLAGLKRAAKARKEDELKIRAERLETGGTLRASTWTDKNKLVWNDIINNARKEWWRSLKMQGATAERTSAFARAMDFAKALGTGLRFVGIGSAAISEIIDSGASPSAQIERILQEFEKKGVAGAVEDNFLRNAEQVLHVDIWGLRAETQAGAVAAATAEATAATPEADADAIEGFNNTHNVLAEKGFHTTIENGVKVIRVELGEGNDFKDVRHALLTVVGQEANMNNLHGKTMVDGVDAGRWLNATANLNDLRTGHTINIEGLTPEKVQQFLSFDKQTGQLVIKDYDHFSSDVMRPLLDHASDKVDEYSGALAWIRKLKEDRFDSIIKARLEDLQEQGTSKTIAVEDFDHSEVVKNAELREFTRMAEGLGIENLEITASAVQDVNNGAIEAGDGRILHIVDGYLEKITTTVGEHTDTYTPDHPIDLDSKDAGEKVTEAMNNAKSGGGEATEAAPNAPAAIDKNTVTPRTFAELIKPSASGGLVKSDGYIHFGDVKFTPSTLNMIDEKSIAQFTKEPLKGFSWINKLSGTNSALEKLANVMTRHSDTGTVGEYIVKYQNNLEGWLRE